MAKVATIVGKRVLTILVNDDQSQMLFETEQGDVSFDVDGDCCSESWFADLTGVDTLLGNTVSAFDEIPLPDYNVNDGRCRQEKDKVYGYRFTTSRGYADLVFRNSSNGWYGGDLYVTMADTRPTLLTLIDEDWHA